MEQIKTAYAWHEALELSKKLVAICEEFSDTDTNVLVGHLRNSVVDIPTAIAAGLRSKKLPALEPLIKLGATIELVHKIYPAIDTGDIDVDIEAFIDRLSTDRFFEQEADDDDVEEEYSVADTASTDDPDSVGEDVDEEVDEAPQAPTARAIPVPRQIQSQVNVSNEPRPTGGTILMPHTQKSDDSSPVTTITPSRRL